MKSTYVFNIKYNSKHERVINKVDTLEKLQFIVHVTSGDDDDQHHDRIIVCSTSYSEAVNIVESFFAEDIRSIDLVEALCNSELLFITEKAEQDIRSNANNMWW